MDLPTEPPPAKTTAAAARRVLLGFGARELGVGVVAVAVITLAAAWFRRDSAHQAEALGHFRATLSMQTDMAEVYRERFAALRAQAERLHREADAAPAEPQRSWARERAKRFDALVAAINRETEDHTFGAAREQAAAAAASGNLAAAEQKLALNPAPLFPSDSEFERLRHDLYETPLAEFSRQSPDLYRVFRAGEPELAQRDEQALRAEIAAAGTDDVTPQAMLKVDLLSAVAARDDPLVADWAARAGAMDYFENPDGTTLAAWRRAQRAVRANDWPTAAAEMLAISSTTVRTRAAFRLALGRALLRKRPDDPAAAYPYIAQAGAAGDNEARQWLAAEDIRQQRYGQARRWLEVAAADGDGQAVPALLELYANHAQPSEDPRNRIAVLERIVAGDNAPPEALLAVARLYEQVDPAGSAAKALACYRRAAAKGDATGSLEVARCALKGLGMKPSAGEARIAAAEAFERGQREPAAAILSDVMRRAPEGNARAIAALFAKQSLATKSPFLNSDIVDGPGVRALRAELARYFDRLGDFGRAAQFYGGAQDAAAERRRAELTTAHPCETCGGSGKVSESVDCPACGGTGKHLCSYCGGTGTIYVPGTPPCPTCGGSGTMVQDRKVVSCSVCGGTGKGSGTVIPQACTHCEHGYVRCTECTNGKIRLTKDCPDCHGRGSWTLVERSAGG
jgi:hypothetical protein